MTMGLQGQLVPRRFVGGDCVAVAQGGAIRQIFSRPDHFSLTYMTRKGRGRYRKPPLRMRVSVYV